MAQAGSDYDQFQDDPNEGKGGLFSKLKDKTKEHGRKLRSKMTGSDNSDSTGDTGATNLDEGEDEGVDAPVSQPPTGGNVGSYDKTPADTTGPTPDEEGLTKSFQGLSTNDQSGPEKMDTTPGPESTNEADSGKAATEQVSDGLTSAKDQTKETVLGSNNPEQQDTSAAPPVTEQVGQQAQQVGDKASETGKTWSQWAAEKVGYAKDTTAANIPTTAEGKPIHQHAYDTVAANMPNMPTTAEGKPLHQHAYDTATANMPTTAEGKPIHQHAYDKAVEAKNSIAAQTDPNQIPSDPAQQTYLHKATGGIYGAKDSLYSATQPGEHDKALSQKVTETVGNLPATIKSSLGFGSKTGSSPTTSPASSDTPVSSSTEEAPGAPPQSPSLVGRITGLFGTKKPATGESTPSSETATSETGAEPTTTS